MIDWAALMTKYGIDYIDSGSRTTKGHVNVKCPLCRNDHGHHMGLNTKNGKWYCWRGANHRGNDPAKILSLLASIPYEDAKREVDMPADRPAVSELRQKLGHLLKKPEELETPKVVWPGTAFIPTAKTGRAFRDYMRKRGFPGTAAFFVRYNLRACLVGRYKHRVLCPAYGEDRAQIGWTGRHIGSNPLRYDAYPEGRVLASAIYVPPDAYKGRVLVITEGFTDALKIDLAGRDDGVRACALFTLTFRSSQLAVLRPLLEGFNRVVLLLDRGAHTATRKAASHLAYMRPTIGKLPEHRDDPGSLTIEEARHLTRSWVAMR